MVDANTPIVVEILRISAITFLYSVSILGWGDLARRFFPASDDSFIDYLSTRLVLGCFSLYAALILLSAGKVLNRTSVTAALAVGLLFWENLDPTSHLSHWAGSRVSIVKTGAARSAAALPLS